jgi:SPP1 family predicted phage head-tail adaptor
MDIGQLNQRAVVEFESSTQDAIGQPVPTWSTFANVHCRIRHLAGSQEGPMAGTTLSKVRIEIRTRYRTDITPAMRFTHKGKTYRIIGVRPNEMNQEWTDFDCELIE